MAFSPDGKQLGFAGMDGTVKVWDAGTGLASLTLKGHSGEVKSVAFSPDGRRLASASFDGPVKVWDAKTGQETLTLKGHTSSVNSVVFNPDWHWRGGCSVRKCLMAEASRSRCRRRSPIDWLFLRNFTSQGGFFLRFFDHRANAAGIYCVVMAVDSILRLQVPEVTLP